MGKIKAKPAADVFGIHPFKKDGLKLRMRYRGDGKTVFTSNPVFRLFGSFTFYFLVGWSGFLCLAEFIGDNGSSSIVEITCHHTGKSYDKLKDVIKTDRLIKFAKTYCYRKESFTVYNYFPNGTVDLAGLSEQGIGPEELSSEEDGVKERHLHNYFQWMAYVLFLSAVLLRLPYYLWTNLEGGFMSRFVTYKIQSLQFNKASIAGPEDADKWNKELQIYAKSIRNYQKYQLNRSYAWLYILCEILNFTALISCMHFTDLYLGNEFRTYGFAVFEILSRPVEFRPDPLNSIFPKIIKCSFFRFGHTQQIEKVDMLCSFGINLLGEKIFAFVWLWYTVLFVISICNVMYRFLVLLSPLVRNVILRSRVMQKHQLSMPAITRNLCYSDWFVLKRISDNLPELIFGDVCCELENTLKKEKHTLQEVQFKAVKEI